MKTSLYEMALLNKELEEILLTDPDEFTGDMLNYIVGNIKGKVDDTVGFFHHLESQVEIAKEKNKEIREFIKTRENALENIKSRFKNVLELMDTKFLDGDLFTIAKTEYEKQLLVIDNEDKLRESLPFELQDLFFTPVIEYKINKDAIKEYLEKGGKLDQARLEKQKDSIQFKTKPLKRTKKIKKEE